MPAFIDAESPSYKALNPGRIRNKSVYGSNPLGSWPTLDLKEQCRGFHVDSTRRFIRDNLEKSSFLQQFSHSLSILENLSSKKTSDKGFAVHVQPEQNASVGLQATITVNAGSAVPEMTGVRMEFDHAWCKAETYTLQGGGSGDERGNRRDRAVLHSN